MPTEIEQVRPIVIVPYPEGSVILKWVQYILDSYQLDLRYEVLAGDDGYRQLLQRIWADRRTVVIVEHDVVPWYGAIEELYSCMGRWCSCSYRYHGGYGLYHGLGCTKLSPDLMEATPSIWDEPGHWSTLDQRLLFAARAVSLEPHPHRPPVLHLKESEYQS